MKVEIVIHGERDGTRLFIDTDLHVLDIKDKIEECLNESNNT